MTRTPSVASWALKALLNFQAIKMINRGRNLIIVFRNSAELRSAMPQYIRIHPQPLVLWCDLHFHTSENVYLPNQNTVGNGWVGLFWVSFGKFENIFFHSGYMPIMYLNKKKRNNKKRAEELFTSRKYCVLEEKYYFNSFYEKDKLCFCFSSVWQLFISLSSPSISSELQQKIKYDVVTGYPSGI